jgi:LysR family glycine cleavage system transcriptional activator
MRKLIPPLSALIAFESASRWGSFSRAAEELSLTQSAISRQIALLEGFVGVDLFERRRQRVFLTEAGRFYGQEIHALLNRLAASTSEVSAYQRGSVLKLAVPPSFGTHWLVPRLKGFIDQHPHVALSLSDWVRPVGFGPGSADAAIHFGDVPWPDLEIHPLMAEDVVPVASPSLVADLKLAIPPDLLRARLLVQETRPQLWSQWFASRGVEDIGIVPRLTFSHFAMVVQAAVAGLGVAIAPVVLMGEQLQTGHLVPLCGPPLRGREHYQLIYPARNADRADIIAFRTWIVRTGLCPDPKRPSAP